MEDSASLCRICLQNGATLPIFGKSEQLGESVYDKLSLCLQSEKIEDVNGFPRNICSVCNTTLDTLASFITKYRESSKILENGLKIVKAEHSYDVECEFLSEVYVKTIKEELDNHQFDEDTDSDYFLQPSFEILEKVKKEPIKKEIKPRRAKTKGSKTNKIASSILEGNFLWNGDKWCMTIGQTTLKKLGTNTESKPRPQTKVKVPHIRHKPEKKLCDLCGDVFKNQDKLNIHKKKVHFKNPVNCPNCPRICASKYSLSRHIKRKHETSRDFICSACGQGFAFKGEMMSHFRNVHNKHLKPKKMYACQFCDKTYKCQKSIVIHERSVHTGQRPAECNICGSSFYHEDYLKEHMRLHTGETPFKCPICGRGYAQRGNMKSHLRIHRISELNSVTLSKIKPNYLKLLKA